MLSYGSLPTEEGMIRGNSTNILYFDALQKLELSTDDLTPMTSSLMGFTYYSYFSLGTVNLNIMFGNKLYFKMMMPRFLAIDIPLAYNAIRGRPTLTKLKVVVSTYHMVMKFSMKIGIRELRSNTRELY